MVETSLIIPNFNNAKFIEECLRTALTQSRPFHEIIVVDDGSEDDSVKIIQAMCHHHSSIKLYSLGGRMGVSRARDFGIKAAVSPFISTIDSDDFFWNHKKNELEMEVIEAAHKRERIAAFSDVRRVALDGADLGSVAASKEIRQGSIYNWLLFLRGFVPRDFTFPRDAYAEVGGYDPQFSLYEDWDFKLRLAQVCEFRFTGSTGVAYRNNPFGLSRVPVGSHLSAMSKVIMKNTRRVYEPLRSIERVRAHIGMLWFLRGLIRNSVKQRLFVSKTGNK